MSKERLFELIRKEDVVLFVGAGFSKYAGYPLGPELAKYIYSKLTESERKEIQFTTDLPVLCEEIYNYKKQNKNFLFQCLKEVFGVKNKILDVHRQLSTIPQFKGMITTNYDTLFEDAFDKIQVIRTDKDIPLTNFNETHLYKIHGDLVNLDQIILMTEDYEKYFEKRERSLFWDAVRTELIKKHILFIGYSADDTNIRTIIRKINQELGSSKKESFFIAPEISKSKLNFLNSFKINYIRSTGEIFIQELLEDLNKNYIPSIYKDGGSLDTISKFGNYRNLKFNLTKNERTKEISIERAEALDTSRPTPLKIQLTTITKSQELEDFLKSNKESISLSVADLDDFSVNLGQTRIHSKETIDSFTIEKLPHYNDRISFVFEDGYETSEFHLKIRSSSQSNSKKTVVIEMLGFLKTIEIEINPDDSIGLKADVKPNGKIKKVKDGIEFYEIMTRIMKGMKFKAYKESKILYEHGDNFQLKMSGNFEITLEYFYHLKHIETSYGIRFHKFELNNSLFEKIDQVMAFLTKQVIARSFEFHKVQQENQTEEMGKMKDDFVFLSTETVRKKINLNEIELDIGYPFYLISDAYIKAEDNPEKTNHLKISSRTNTIYCGFSNKSVVNLQEFTINQEQL